MLSGDSIERSRAARSRALVLVQQSHALHETAFSLMYENRRCRELLNSSITSKRQLLTALGPATFPPVWTSDAAIVEHIEPEDSKSARPPSFELEGVIEDQPVSATFERGILICDALLRSHAELVVALGDSFVDARSGQSRPASLEGTPVVVLATLMRAMRVTRVQVAM